MTNLYKTLNNFVNEIWGFNLIEEPINRNIERIEELKNAHRTIMDIIHNKRKPFSDEFVKYVYPLLEISVQWAELKNIERFLEKCKQRVNTQSNFYGTIFEIDMASRCLLSNWDVNFVEDYSEEGKQIDFLFLKKGKVAGVECLSKRYSNNSLTIDKINKDISEKAKKFDKKYIEKLKIPLHERLLIINITTPDYSTPKILKDIEGTRMSSKLDAVIFTWREDIIVGMNHSLIIKYKIFGNIDKKYFSVTHASEFRVTDEGPVFFMRKYVEPEPTYVIGPEESNENNYKNTET